MSLDCDDLHACADLLHQAAAREMEAAQREGSHQRAYNSKLRKVVALEEGAAVVEEKISEAC